jgi:hypothetical protein
MNELQEQIESKVITRTFNVSGMPESNFKMVDEFCKEFYGDSRWVMIVDLLKNAQEDYKYAMLYEEIQQLKQELAEMKEQPQQKKDVRQFKSFGEKVN